MEGQAETRQSYNLKKKRLTPNPFFLLSTVLYGGSENHILTTSLNTNKLHIQWQADRHDIHVCHLSGSDGTDISH
jgi:CDP-diacylglycerol pyrophosphatase